MFDGELTKFVFGCQVVVTGSFRPEQGAHTASLGRLSRSSLATPCLPKASQRIELGESRAGGRLSANLGSPLGSPSTSLPEVALVPSVSHCYSCSRIFLVLPSSCSRNSERRSRPRPRCSEDGGLPCLVASFMYECHSRRLATRWL